jgi:hypothetical protein
MSLNDLVFPEGFTMQVGMRMANALILSGCLLGFAASVHAGSLTVKTGQGKVRGKTINDGKVKAFLGLPYATFAGRRRRLPPRGRICATQRSSLTAARSGRSGAIISFSIPDQARIVSI